MEAYYPDSLKPAGWSSQQRVPPLDQVLGADPDERAVWALDRQHNLILIDLDSRAVRKELAGITAGILGPDGSLYLSDAAHHIIRVVRRQPVRFRDSLPTAPRALFGAVNDQLVALTGGARPRMITAHSDQVLHSIAVPRGASNATAWGDLVAIVADSAVLLYETGGQLTQSALPVRHPRAVGFSPSGHRIFVSGEDQDIRVFDRFTLSRIAAIRLPGRPSEFRIDRSGRWMLAHPAAGDTIWVVDLATSLVSATVQGGWAEDLPLVAGAATLVLRDGDVVRSLDLRQSPPHLMASLEGGAEDLWLAAVWVPPERVPAAVAAAESASVTQDSALRADSTRITADSTATYLQVSRTQNPDWAELLSKQLKGDGYPALVLPPREAEDGYRVLLGPYATREAAESTGKRLGRAYFLLKLPAKTP